jgi:lysophospholipase L1-like esterase
MALGTDTSPVRILGFGACMISGFPHESGGFFEVGCRLVERELNRRVEAKVVSLHNFPAPRAVKHLSAKLSKHRPSYVVIQFGATDANCAVRRSNRRTASTNSATERSIPSNRYRPPNAAVRLRWEVASVAAFVRRPAPITSEGAFIEALKHMADDCLSASAIPIVLTPFVFGSRYSTKNAIRYAHSMAELAKDGQIVVIDCVQLLGTYPKKSTLLNDGFHLSQLAHGLIGEALAKAIIEDAGQRCLLDAVAG